MHLACNFVPMFRFKRFALQHGPGLKVTTDAVFFGAWAPLLGEGPLLDVGAGTGLLAAMAAQRRPTAGPLHLLEPNAAAAALCKQNMTQLPFKASWQLFEQQVEAYEPAGSYADILMNPPFFEESLPRQSQDLSQALHADRALLERWLGRCRPWLLPGGRLHLMVRPQARPRVLSWALKHGISVLQEGFLHHSPAHEPMRYLACLAKTDGAVPRRPNWYVQGDDAKPDPAYRALVQDFYLNL